MVSATALATSLIPGFIGNKFATPVFTAYPFASIANTKILGDPEVTSLSSDLYYTAFSGFRNGAGNSLFDYPHGDLLLLGSADTDQVVKPRIADDGNIVADLPASREVKHTYSDGPLSPTIVIDLVDEDGTHTAADTLALAVVNVPPNVSLSGPNTIDEGTSYTLTIGAVNDLGTDTVTQFVIHWGDGQQQTIDVADLPASREVKHTYADGPFSPTIVIDLVDEDSTHTAADTLALAVVNVPPNVSLSGPNTIDEGTSYTLTIGEVTDLGTDTVTQFVIHWGDGQQQTIHVADLPANREVTHTYADGPLSPTIAIDLVDDDGTHTTAGTLELIVLNVVPDVTLSGPATVSEDTPYILTIEGLSDPGNNIVQQIVIDWGDGPPEAIDVDDFPDDDKFTHTYGDGPVSVTILVDLLAADGTHLAQFTRHVDVLDDEGIVLDHIDTTASVPGETDRNATVMLTAEFTDLGTPETHTAMVNWGDGSEPQTVEVTQIDSLGVVTATHDYDTRGVSG